MSSTQSTVDFEIIFDCVSSAEECDQTATATSDALSTNTSDAKVLGQVQQAMTARSLEPPAALTTVKRPTVKLEVEVLACPPFGVDCGGDTHRYMGDVWHNPSVDIPNCTTLNGTKACTGIYTCVNAGCPKRGASKMKCREGYKVDAPLCAICDEGYYMQMRDCHACGDSFRVTAFLTMLAIMLIALGLLCRLVLRYWWLLGRSSTMSHAKILISFVTVLISVDVQFGVAWPPAFAQALDLLSIFSFDLGVLGGILCHVDYGFYDLLFGSTMLLLGMVLAIWLVYFFLRRLATGSHGHSELYQRAMYVAVYLCLFAYPVVSVRVIDTFGCHEVEGVSYLRADYSIECYTSRWWGNAVYAGIWILFFVFLFPLAVTYKLWCYHGFNELMAKQGKGAKRRSVHKRRVMKQCWDGELVDLHFLLDDYKPDAPAMLWESAEMIRKLLLCVVGAFWSTKSTICIAIALLISVCFQLLHEHFLPYKSEACNRLQSISLAILSIIYFIGVLLKTQSVRAEDSDSIGWLLIGLLSASLVAAVATIVLEVRATFRWLREVKYVKAQTDGDDGLYNPELHKHILDVNDLTLGKVLGKGAQGAVYAGKLSGTPVAIKVVAVSQCLGSGERLKAMLDQEQKEAQMLLELRHPNVVTVYGIAIDVDDVELEVKVHTVLELCTGALDEKINSKDLNWQEGLELCLQTAKGMQYLHSKGVYHRDLKPANVLIGQDGHALLADFGLSKKIDIIIPRV